VDISTGFVSRQTFNCEARLDGLVGWEGIGWDLTMLGWYFLCNSFFICFLLAWRNRKYVDNKSMESHMYYKKTLFGLPTLYTSIKNTPFRCNYQVI